MLLLAEKAPFFLLAKLHRAKSVTRAVLDGEDVLVLNEDIASVRRELVGAGSDSVCESKRLVG
jgi:hypothetical protein